MDKPVSRHRKGRTVIVLSIAGLVTVAVIGVGLFGLVHGQSAPTPAETRTSTRAATTATGPASPVRTAAPTIPATVDVDQFARHVAVTVFTWDTTSLLEPVDYMQAVLDVGDPTGQETPGLAADLTDYLPDTAAWAQLRQYQTRQWLTIDTATVPTSWAQALQQGQGTLPPGTNAYTITGTRHRAGVWGGKPAATAEPVSFTIFETCQPTYRSCRLLRLSQLDHPLH